MFNFTTTTLIHSADQFVANPTNQTAGQIATGYQLNPSKNTLWVNGVNLFRKENVVAIYRSPYIEPLAGRLVVDIANVFSTARSNIGNAPSKIHFRLKFSLRRTGDNNSYYARDEVFKGKDFIYEWVGTSSTAAADVAKQIKKINRLYGDIYLDVHVGTSSDNQVLYKYDTVDGDAFGDPVDPDPDGIKEVNETGKLVFVNDNFGMFTDASLEYWADGVSDCCHYEDGGWIEFDRISLYNSICVNNCSSQDCDVITRGIKESECGLLHIVDCVNGTGTYQQILRDLRLPTMENLGYMSLTQQMNEMPVPGMKYVQYTLHYVTCRGILGGSAVGEVTHSKTTHVFFVPATCCNCEGTNYVDLDKQFLAALKAAFDWEPCQGSGRLVSAPHDDPTVAPSFMGQLHPAALDETRTNNDTRVAANPSEEPAGSDPEPTQGEPQESDHDDYSGYEEDESVGGGDVPGVVNGKSHKPATPLADENDVPEPNPVGDDDSHVIENP